MNVLRLVIRSFLAAVVFWSGLTFMVAGPAGACSCMGPLEWIRNEGGPDTVFIGEMIELRDIEERNEFGGAAVEMTFQVETVFRGQIKDHVFVQSHRDDGGNCGFNGGSGSMVILASRSDDGSLQTDGCSVMSVALDGSTEQELEALIGPGMTPEAVDPALVETVREQRRAEGPSVPWSTLSVGAGVLVLLGVGLTFVVRGQDRV